MFNTASSKKKEHPLEDMTVDTEMHQLESDADGDEALDYLVSFCEAGIYSPGAKNSARAIASPPPIPLRNGGLGTARTVLSSSYVSLSPSSSTQGRSISAVSSTASSMSTTTSQSRPWHNVDYKARSTMLEGMIANVWRDVRDWLRKQKSQTELRSPDDPVEVCVVAEYKRQFHKVVCGIYQAVSVEDEELMPLVGSNPIRDASELYKKLRHRKSQGRLEEVPASPDGLRFFGAKGGESDILTLYKHIRGVRDKVSTSLEEVEGDNKMPACASTPKRKSSGFNEGGSSTTKPASKKSRGEDAGLDDRLGDAMELLLRDEKAKERCPEFFQLVMKLRDMDRSDLLCLTEQVLIEALERLWPRPSTSPKSPPPHNPGDCPGSGSHPRRNGNDTSHGLPPPPPPPNQGDGPDDGSHPRGNGTGNNGAGGCTRSSDRSNRGDNPGSTGGDGTFGSDGYCDGQSPSEDRSFTGDRQEGRDVECVSKVEDEKRFLEGARCGDLSVVQRFVHKGVDVNIKDSFGWTALHMASANGFSEIVQLLVDNDADIKAEAEDGLTPFDVAWTNEVSEYLRLRLITSNFMSGVSMPNDMEASSGSSCSELTSTSVPDCLQISPLSAHDTDTTDKRPSEASLLLANLTIGGSCCGLGNDEMKCLPESSQVAPAVDIETGRNKKTTEPESETALSWGYNEILDSDGLGDDEMRGLQESSQVAPSVNSEGGRNKKTMEHESERAQSYDSCPRSNDETDRPIPLKGHSASTCATDPTMCSSTRSDLSQLGESSASLNDQLQDERPPLKRAIPMPRVRRGQTITNEPDDASLAAADEDSRGRVPAGVRKQGA